MAAMQRDKDGIILYGTGEDEASLHGEDCEALEKAGYLVWCGEDTLNDDEPACGYQHQGPGFYHLAPGVDIDDLP